MWFGAEENAYSQLFSRVYYITQTVSSGPIVIFAHWHTDQICLAREPQMYVVNIYALKIIW